MQDVSLGERRPVAWKSRNPLDGWPGPINGKRLSRHGRHRFSPLTDIGLPTRLMPRSEGALGRVEQCAHILLEVALAVHDAAAHPSALGFGRVVRCSPEPHGGDGLVQERCGLIECQKIHDWASLSCDGATPNWSDK